MKLTNVTGVLRTKPYRNLHYFKETDLVSFKIKLSKAMFPVKRRKGELIEQTVLLSVCVSVSACVCAYVHMCVCVCACTCRGEHMQCTYGYQKIALCISSCCPSYWRQHLFVSQISCPANLQEYSALWSPPYLGGLVLTQCYHVYIYMFSGVPNTGPHACMASSYPLSNLSSPPCFPFYCLLLLAKNYR